MHFLRTKVAEQLQGRFSAQRFWWLILNANPSPQGEGLCTFQPQRGRKAAPAGFLLSVFG
jgi:hypothetical protein